MKKITINSVSELEENLEKYKDGFLFRGQTGHYLNNSGQISIPTSFKRHGCIPPVMLKWTHYSKSLLRAFDGEDYHNLDMGISQAILQHYGWRSFYIDLTKDSHVACWFASHKYIENKRLFMCEDFEENPVWLAHKEAEYIDSPDNGHIYVIDVEYLKENNITIHDLTTLSDGG